MSCCCPARSCWPGARRTRRPWIYASYGVGLDAVARRFHRYLRSRRSTRRVDATGDDQRLGGGLLRPRPRERWSPWPSAAASSVSSASCSTTAGSAPAATTTPAWATGPSRRTSGRTDCTRWSTRSRSRDAVRPVVRARDDQPRLRRRPGAPGVGDGHRRPAAGRVAPPAGDQPGHPRVLRPRPRRDARASSTSTTSATSSGTTTAT